MAVKPGNLTSENKMSWVSLLLNLILVVSGAIASALTDSVWGAIAGAVGAAVNSFLASSYNKSRGQVKAADSLAKAKTTNPK